MNWLMELDPVVVGSLLAGAIGVALLVAGWNGPLVSRADHCRRCGQEAAPKQCRCTECGAMLRPSSMQISFGLNYPLLARFISPTRQGKRRHRHGLLLIGLLLTMTGLSTFVVVSVARRLSFDWYSLRSTAVLLAEARSAPCGDIRQRRAVAVLKARRDSRLLDPAEEAEYFRASGSLSAYDQLVALSRSVPQHASVAYTTPQPPGAGSGHWLFPLARPATSLIAAPSSQAGPDAAAQPGSAPPALFDTVAIDAPPDWREWVVAGAQFGAQSGGAGLGFGTGRNTSEWAGDGSYAAAFLADARAGIEGIPASLQTPRDADTPSLGSIDSLLPKRHRGGASWPGVRIDPLSGSIVRPSGPRTSGWTHLLSGAGG